jgi:hypothetical protein
MLGVNNINSMTECTHVLPPRILTVAVTDNAAAIANWLEGQNGNNVSAQVADGTPVD